MGRTKGKLHFSARLQKNTVDFLKYLVKSCLELLQHGAKTDLATNGQPPSSK